MPSLRPKHPLQCHRAQSSPPASRLASNQRGPVPPNLPCEQSESSWSGQARRVPDDDFASPLVEPRKLVTRAFSGLSPSVNSTRYTEVKPIQPRVRHRRTAMKQSSYSYKPPSRASVSSMANKRHTANPVVSASQTHLDIMSPVCSGSPLQRSSTQRVGTKPSLGPSAQETRGFLLTLSSGISVDAPANSLGFTPVGSPGRCAPAVCETSSVHTAPLSSDRPPSNSV